MNGDHVEGNADGKRPPVLVTALSCLAAALLFAMMALVVADVVARYILASPIRGSFEIIGFLLGLMVFTGLAAISHRNDHITVSILDHLFRGWVRWVQQTFVLLFSAATVGFIAYGLFATAEHMRVRGTLTLMFDIPLAPLVHVLAAMSSIGCALLVALLVRYVRAGRGEAAKPPGLGT